MQASSILVNAAEDAEVRLVNVLAETLAVCCGVENEPTGTGSDAFQTACTESLLSGDPARLLETIMQHQAVLQQCLVETMESAEEAVSALSILAALLDRVTPADKQDALAKQLADAICLDTSNDVGSSSSSSRNTMTSPTTIQWVERRMTLLCVLYNMRIDTKEKCLLLQRMMHQVGTHPDGPRCFLSPDSVLGRLLEEDSSTSACTTTGSMSMTHTLTTSVISPFQTPLHRPPRIVAMSASLPLQLRREMLFTIATILPEGDRRKQRFYLLLVETYPAGSPLDSMARIAAKEAALGAIRDPVTLFVYQRNLLAWPAVQDLATSQDPAEQSLYRLLCIFLQGQWSDYQAYCTAHGGEVAALAVFGLDAAACQRHVKILSLCSLAAEHEEIPYAVIAETLQLAGDTTTATTTATASGVLMDQVETWVICAVSSGLLQAKMDQMSQKVVVERCVVRRFEMDEWKTLRNRLAAWRDHVGTVLSTLQQSRQPHAVSSISRTTTTTSTGTTHVAS